VPVVTFLRSFFLRGAFSTFSSVFFCSLAMFSYCLLNL
jgi:hypothetical protein